MRFRGRTLWERDMLRLSLFVSNFGESDMAGCGLRWHILGNGVSLTGALDGVSAPLGKCTQAAELEACIPELNKAAKLVLTLELTANGRTVSQNTWDFWAFPQKNKRLSSKIAYDFADSDLKRKFKNTFGGTVGLRELDSVVRGCRSWTDADYDKTFETLKPSLMVSDAYSDTVQQCLRHGITVLLLDNGRFPESWYTAPAVPHLGDEDTARFFTGFRCGWDQGNLATLIQDSPLLDGIPHGEFCDLQFFAMLNGARTLIKEEVFRDTGAKDGTIVLSSLAKQRPPAAIDVVVQDPNALKELKSARNRSLYAQERVFLAELNAGGGKLILSALRHFDDPAGEAMLYDILNKHLQEG